jgi:hypothetical protein
MEHFSSSIINQLDTSESFQGKTTTCGTKCQKLAKSIFFCDSKHNFKKTFLEHISKMYRKNLKAILIKKGSIQSRFFKTSYQPLTGFLVDDASIRRLETRSFLYI